MEPPSPQSGALPTTRNEGEITPLPLRLAAMDGESQAQREQRLQQLWRKLDVRRTGSLDYADLKHGLEGMQHRESCLPSSKYQYRVHAVHCLIRTVHQTAC